MLFHSSVRHGGGTGTARSSEFALGNQDSPHLADKDFFGGLPSASAATSAATGMVGSGLGSLENAASAASATAAVSAVNVNINANGSSTSNGTGISVERVRKLESLISSHLSQLNIESALFIAELFYAECSSLEDESREKTLASYYYALSLFMDGDYHTSMFISSPLRHQSVANAYIYARCCLKLRKNYSNALDTLLSLQYHWDSSLPHFGYPKKSTICLLVGKLFRLLDHDSKSEAFFKSSLDEDPYLWEASEELCKLRSPLALTAFELSTSVPSVPIGAGNLQSQGHGQGQGQGQSKMQNQGQNQNHSQSHNHSRVQGYSTNSLDPKSKNKPHTPFKVPTRNKQNVSFSQNNSLLSSSNIGASVSPHFFKKTRFTTTPTTSATTTNAIPNNMNDIPLENKNIGVTTPSKLYGTDSHTKLLRSPMERKIMTGSSFNSNNNNNNNGISDNANANSIRGMVFDHGLEELFSNFIRIEYCKCKYDSFKAIRIMQSKIPLQLAVSMPWCLSSLGKLHFELGNYEMAKSYFIKLRSLQPTRFKDMDIFSTILWHLQDKITLSSLCAELLTLDKYHPVAWCTLGNLHSLNKDHDEAISAFGKAIQLDPFFAYAYTLQGHEYSNNDSFDKAKSCFRKALTIDKTHYNALYGLGMCCVKLGKFEEALLYFEKARVLNPVNVILNCCCGVALERLQQPEKALNFYELANELQPNSSLALFKKSQLLLNMGQYSSALHNFERLVTLTPDEAHVHFLLGNLYQIVGKKQDAMNQYTIAMNLDPKGSQLIKEAMEKCHEQG